MTHEPLPLRSAMHRDDPKGSRLEIANAYAVGRLIDGQAIADAWSEYRITCHLDAGKLRDRLYALLDALIEETDNE